MLTDSHDVYYSDTCFSSHHLFGCAGLRNAEYCILNRQYSKEEYESLIPQIIEHMKATEEYGEFFPARLSPFTYNESTANEYMPLHKEEALAQGFKWQDEIPHTSGQETISHDKLPKDSQELSDDLLKEVLKCERCTRNYRLILQELNFYRKMNLPVPNECFNCRHERRMKMRNPRQLFGGTCAKCGMHFETSYPPEKHNEFKLYCERCYLEDMG
jgi:hypothetical protein